MALFAGEDGLSCYRALANGIRELATPDSKIFLEIGTGQFKMVSAIFSFAPAIQVTRDLNGKERCLFFTYPPRLLAGHKGYAKNYCKNENNRL
jgi:release factor glutamine methyltransferase